MREIKFRARNANLPRCWIYGYFVIENGQNLIINKEGRFPVIAGTESQNTGLHDKNGKEVYEGDIVAESTVGKLIWDNQAIVTERPIGEVRITPPYINIIPLKAGTTKLTDKANDSLKKYHDGSLHLTRYDGVFQWDTKDIEVVGNIYENLEHLEVK